MMYRVFAIVGGALALAACSSSPDWMSFGGLKSGPMLDTVSFESEPPGAEAKTSNGQTCRTPCSLALPVEAPLTVTFTLNGYASESERLDMVQATGEAPRFGPNPVVAAAHARSRHQKAGCQETGHEETGRSGCSGADDGSTGAARLALADKRAARTAIGG